MRQHLINILVALVAVFAPAQGMIITSIILIVIDLITGLLAAHKQNLPITSAGLKRTIVKLAVYEAAILLGFITQKYLTGDSIPVASIVSGFIGITEFVSCMENLNILGGNNLLKALIDKLGSANKS